MFQCKHSGRCGKLHKATFHRIIEFLSWKGPGWNGPVLCFKWRCPEEASRVESSQAGTLLIKKVIADFSQNHLFQFHWKRTDNSNSLKKRILDKFYYVNVTLIRSLTKILLLTRPCSLIVHINLLYNLDSEMLKKKAL